MIVVSDAGPLIYLGSVGQLVLLQDLFGRVVVPQQVWDEVVGAGVERPGSAAVAAAEGIRVVGTLGLLVRGKRAGLLDAVAPSLNAMMTLGFRVSRDLIDEALALAGEK